MVVKDRVRDWFRFCDYREFRSSLGSKLAGSNLICGLKIFYTIYVKLDSICIFL